MKKNLKIRITNPAGNITIFVLDAVDRSEYASVAGQLLDMREFGAEQVAFVTGDDSMDMCGLEFCGNATRAFALMQAESIGMEGYGEFLSIPVFVSGANGVLEAKVNPRINYAEIEMPLYRSVEDFDEEGVSGSLVDLGGIVHLVLRGVEADDELFGRLKNKIMEMKNPPALGVMFCTDEMIVPVVYVRDVDSVYYEGSCASGATAVAIAQFRGREDGDYSYKARMPEGSLDVFVRVGGGEAEAVRIGSEIHMGEVFEVEVERRQE